GPDLREVLVEPFDDRRSASLVLMTVENELAFLLSFGYVGIGREVENLGRRFGLTLGKRPLSGQNSRRRGGDERGACLEQRAPGGHRTMAAGHSFPPKSF